MNEFNQRWRRLARIARGSEPALPPPPLHRVRDWLATATASAASGTKPAPSALASDLWRRLAMRGLATAVLLLVACLWFAWAGATSKDDQRLFHPGLEQAVVDGFWLL
ncbi:MAG: hypothetical protein IT580_01490 [Verrucomicrobiales bacterium]|nr:hypothetical protein [Verrucomicrobiales bacterium]